MKWHRRFRKWHRNLLLNIKDEFSIDPFIAIVVTLGYCIALFIVGVLVVSAIRGLINLIGYGISLTGVNMESAIGAIAWAFSVLGIIITICATILITNKRERENERYKMEIAIRQAELKTLDNESTKELQELKNRGWELQKELESVRHVQAIERSQRGVA